eukprot:g6646.t1
MASNAPTEMPTSEEQFQEVRSFALDSSRLLEMQVSLLQNYIGEHTAQPEALRPMYVGEDVSPDFYAWVFPKCDHVAVGTGTVVDKKGIKLYQQGIRDRAAPRIEGGKIIRDRSILVGDAAGYVTKCSGEGIYFAAKSGRMCAETIVKNSQQGARMIDEADLMEHLREWDGKYGPTYLVLDLLQKVFYTSDAARESFVELCEEEYVQKVTFDSYLYKTVQGNDPVGDLKLGWKTLSSLYKSGNQLRRNTTKCAMLSPKRRSGLRGGAEREEPESFASLLDQIFRGATGTSVKLAQLAELVQEAPEVLSICRCPDQVAAARKLKRSSPCSFKAEVIQLLQAAGWSFTEHKECLLRVPRAMCHGPSLCGELPAEPSGEWATD